MIYHYTKGFHLPSILTLGLKPSTILVEPGERPIVWFSTNEQWENTVLMLPKEDAHLKLKRVGGAIRIVCDKSVAPYNWDQLRRYGRIRSRDAKAICRSAIAVGARPSHWRGTFDVVPPTEFIAVERYDGTSWIPIADWQGQCPEWLRSEPFLPVHERLDNIVPV